MRIELWIDGLLVGGAEQWWDDIEASLAGAEAESDFPMLSRVDPYGDVSFEGEVLSGLAAEVRRFSPQAPERVQPFLDKLAALCDQGGQGSQAELRFLGD
jgi:hypothetical protein